MSPIEQALRRMKELAKNGGAAADRAPGREPSLVAATTPRAALSPFRPASDVTVTIDRASLRKHGVLAPESEARRIAMEYRTIKRSLLAAITGRGTERVEDGNAIMVASAMPAEGKSFTSVNLALSLAAEKDWSVVLIDGDVAKPHLSRLLGLDAHRGLLDFLVEETCSLEEVAVATDVPGLSFVPAGSHSETATELLSSVRMDQLIQALRVHAEDTIFLFDSPPVLVTSEAKVLADAVGQIVLVVRADETPRSAVTEAIEALGTGKPVGLVLNQYRGRTISTNYYDRGERKDE